MSLPVDIHCVTWGVPRQFVFRTTLTYTLTAHTEVQQGMNVFPALTRGIYLEHCSVFGRIFDNMAKYR